MRTNGSLRPVLNAASDLLSMVSRNIAGAVGVMFRSVRCLATAAGGLLLVAALSALFAAAPARPCQAAQAGWQALHDRAPPRTGPADPGAALTRTGHALAPTAGPYRRTSRQAAKIILALVLAAVAAFDLWILRHLHRAYLSAGRGWRTMVASPGARNGTGESYMDEHPRR
jgi:hypothetical protein